MTKRSKVAPESVELLPGKGGKGRGAGPGGAYWHIHVSGQRAGNVYINVIDEPPLGRHASIQIQLNKNQQGRGIGRIAYRLASEQSEHDEIYAHMAKKNIGSRKAAAAAGYEVVDDERVRQLLMRWRRPTPPQ